MRFSQAELDFIRNELKIRAQEDESREEILDRIWDEACEVEIEESNKGDASLSLRGMMAASLVTKLGAEQQ